MGGGGGGGVLGGQGGGGEQGVCPPPPLRARMGTRIPCCTKRAKVAPMGGMTHKGCVPNYDRGTHLLSNPCGSGGVCRELQCSGTLLEAGGRTAPGDKIFSWGSALFPTCDLFFGPWPLLGSLYALPDPPLL